ncbi:hypothetical protein B0T18DRAFT_397712 [Schizothecium vesticola]|uniref:Rhodopsin domain-containing protein n=1 Tax=Schizothecium vesticola TaxID=314040 RepID=A0AA40F9K1_9PEZI|nr:hypothetical protein B0T18DRAFT_397712 [Schizothecium vesticola]
MDPDDPEPRLEVLFPISARAAHFARVHRAVTIPLLALTLLALLTRLCIRLRPISRLGWDDALLLLGFLCAITDWAFLQRGMFLTPQSIPFDTVTSAIKQAYLGTFFWVLAMTCTKASIAVTLLRIPLVHRAWRPFLFTILSIQALYFIGDTIYIFVGCRPLHAAWDTSVVGAKCADVETDVLVSSIGSALNAMTDLLLSMAPMLVLAKLRLPRRERVLVCGLTGMGLFASGASVAKAVNVGRRGKAEDDWALAMSIATWTVVEQLVAVLAACSPSLKGPIENLLGRCGILLTGHRGSKVSFADMLRSRSERNRGAREIEVDLPVEEGMEIRSGPVVFRDGEDLEEKVESSYAARRARRQARRDRRRAREGSESAGKPQEGVVEGSGSNGKVKEIGGLSGNVHVIPE